LIFPLGVAWMALCYALSKLFPKKHHWEGPKVCSTMGAFLQLGFSTMSATALAPMMCYRHPNGLRSILKYPGVICGSAEHDAMLAIAWVLLLVFVFGFVALCITAVLMAAQLQNGTYGNPMKPYSEDIVRICQTYFDFLKPCCTHLGRSGGCVEEGVGRVAGHLTQDGFGRWRSWQVKQ